MQIQSQERFIETNIRQIRALSIEYNSAKYLL